MASALFYLNTRFEESTYQPRHNTKQHKYRSSIKPNNQSSFYVAICQFESIIIRVDHVLSLIMPSYIATQVPHPTLLSYYKVGNGSGTVGLSKDNNIENLDPYPI